MRTSIFVIALIVVVFMAGALMLSIVYQKHTEKHPSAIIVSDRFAITPAVFASNDGSASDPENVLFKPIVMDHRLSNSYPFESPF